MVNEVSAAVKPPLAAVGASTATSAALVKSRSNQKTMQFNQKASQASKGIQTCALLLARLTNVARSQNLFSDEGDEFGRLSVTVTNEMNDMKKQLYDLQSWLNANDLGQGKDSKLHSEAIVKNMGDKLQESGWFLFF